MNDDVVSPPVAPDEQQKRLDLIIRRLDEIRATTLFGALGPDRIFEFAAFDRAFRMYLPYAASDMVQRHILLSGALYEMRQLQQVRPLIAPGSIVVDAGANIGNHTLFFAMVCGAAQVHAFEPLRTVFPILQRNVALNGLDDRVRCVNAALGAREGGAALTHFASGNISASNFNVETGSDYAVTTLDALNLTRLDFLKIDVEGNHLRVIEGARATIEGLRPKIWIELRNSHDEYAAGDAALRELGYRRTARLSNNDFLYGPA
jgi:FkbM family methyltransferase